MLASAHVTNYNGMPKPIQSPCPPILIGGGGKRVLTYAAQQPTSSESMPSLTAGAVVGSNCNHVSRRCGRQVAISNSVGDRINNIEMNVRAFMVTSTMTPRDPLNAGQGYACRTVNDRGNSFLHWSTGKTDRDLLAQRERWGFSYIIGRRRRDSFAPVVAALQYLNAQPTTLARAMPRCRTLCAPY